MKKSGIGSMCLLGLLLLVWASLAEPTHWCFGLGNLCTAQAAGEEGTLKWKFQTDRSVGSPAIGADGTIYVGSVDDYLYAINSDGSLKWKFEIGPASYSSPAIDSDGTIYVSSEVPNFHPSLCAINSDGSLKWKFRTVSEANPPAIGSDGTIYLPSMDDHLHAINPVGSLKWTFETGGHAASSAIGSDGTIYLGVHLPDGHLYAINPDGSLKWKFWTGGGTSVCSPLVIDSDGTIYAATQPSYLYAINPDGSLKWRFQIYTIGNSPAIGSDGTIYLGSMNASIYADHFYLCAINPDGILKWKFEIGSYSGDPAIGSDGTIYVGSGDHYFYAINPDGTLKWKFKTGAEVYSSPVIDSDGTIYVGSNDHYLYAINSSSMGLANSPWPMSRRDEEHTSRASGAWFSATPTCGVAPLTVQFTNRSVGESNFWLWDFGDGSTSTERSPSHVYTDAGAYTVSLAVTGPEGGDTETRKDCILVGSDVMYVPDDFPTIQGATGAAIDRLSKIIVRDGTYTGTGNVNLDFGGKEIRLESENGPEKCIIDGENSARGFYFNNQEKEGSVISGFTIRNCTAPSSPQWEGGGGAIKCTNSSPTISNCIITGNSARLGAGVFIKDGSPVITGCTIAANHAEATGGGIHSTRSTARITGCTIARNTAGARGAGVLCEGGPSPTFTGCKIANNAAQGSGGGIYCRSGSSAAIINCLITGNTAISGGGLTCKESSPAITNCTIVGNSVRGITCYGRSNPAIANSILWGNQTREILRNVSYGYRPRPKVTFSNISGGFPGEGNIDSDPMFVDSANADYHLAVGSPSINTGNNDAPNLPQTDRDDHPRIVDGVVDMGAYEYQGS
jgi:outer membrane protein assembly factor BamB